MARTRKSKSDPFEPVDDIVKTDPVPDVDDLDADTPPAPTEPPKGPNVTLGVEASTEAIAALIAAFPDAREIYVTSCMEGHVVAQIDFVPKKIFYKE